MLLIINKNDEILFEKKKQYSEKQKNYFMRTKHILRLSINRARIQTFTGINKSI